MKTNKYILLGLVIVTLESIAFSAQATPSTSYYIYDESGHIIGEYDQNGNPVQEHVYLGDRPVAVVQGGSSSGGTVDYVTTDQLNTPRAITDSSGTVQWSWSSDPFGNGTPTGSLTYNLRFPGQYYDAETGHNYNYHRDYDPSTGRYIESDPIGLNGGANTYTYVGDDPMDERDPKGLCYYQYMMVTSYNDNGYGSDWPHKAGLGMIAVANTNPKPYPYGCQMTVYGTQTYTGYVHDTGAGWNASHHNVPPGVWIDIWLPGEQAWQWGVQWAVVKICCKECPTSAPSASDGSAPASASGGPPPSPPANPPPYAHP